MYGHRFAPALLALSGTFLLCILAGLGYYYFLGAVAPRVDPGLAAVVQPVPLWENPVLRLGAIGLVAFGLMGGGVAFLKETLRPHDGSGRNV